jgi:hypothetical protein
MFLNVNTHFRTKLGSKRVIAGRKNALVALWLGASGERERLWSAELWAKRAPIFDCH